MRGLVLKQGVGMIWGALAGTLALEAAAGAAAARRRI